MSDEIYYNGLWLAEVEEYEMRTFKITIMFNRVPNVEACTFAKRFTNPC